MEHYKEGERLGGAHGELYCRKESVISSLQKNPFTGKPCIRIELSRNCTSAISKSLDISDSDIKAILDKFGMHHKLDDRLVADAISVYVDQRRPVKFTVKEGATHRHGGRFASTTNPTFSEIKYPQEHIRNAEVKRIELQRKLEQKI